MKSSSISLFLKGFMKKPVIHAACGLQTLSQKLLDRFILYKNEILRLAECLSPPNKIKKRMQRAAAAAHK